MPIARIATLFLFIISGLHAVFAQENPQEIINRGVEDTLTVQAYVQLSVKSLSKSYDSSLFYAQKGKEIAQRIDDQKGYRASLMRMGNAYMFKAEYDSAHNTYMEVLALNESMGDFLEMGKVYNNLGLMYRYKADYPTSLEYFIKSLEFKRKYGTDIDVGVGYQNIGIVFAIQREYETAEKYLLDGLELFRKGGDSTKYHSALIDVSSMMREQGKMEEAIQALKEAYEYNRRRENTTQMGICIYNMAFTSYLDDDYTAAINYYLQAKDIFVQLGNRVRITGCNIRLTICYKETGQLKKAERVAREGLEIFSELNSPVQQYTLQESLADVLAAQGKYKEAYSYRVKHDHLKDSITSEEHQIKIAEMQAKHENEVDKRKIAELTAENKQNQLQARKKEVQTYILYGAVLLILILAIMFYFLAVNKKKANDALREKNKVIEHSLDEKEVLLREIYHRVQNNLQFVSSLLNLQSRRVEDEGTKNVLKECKLRVQSMALIHQRLYKEESLKGISFENYIKNLVQSLQESYQIEEGRIATVFEIDDILMDIDTAIPMGLILNELITNAYKYAFPDFSKGELQIRLKQEDGLTLSVADNGIGLREDFDINKSNSFGLKLVRSLAKKLNADVQFSSEGGTQVKLIIKENNLAQ